MARMLPADATIGDRLRSLRIERGLTQEQLAEVAGVSTDLIKKLEQGRRDGARLTTLTKLAEALDAPRSQLIDKRPRLDGAGTRLVLGLRDVLISPDLLVGVDPRDDDGAPTDILGLQRLVRQGWHDYAARLYTTLTAIRRQLQPLLGDDPITRHDDRYQLNTHAVDTDLDPLRHAVAAARALASAQQRNAYEAVIDAYHGELATPHAWPWLQPVREALRRDVIDAYRQLAATATPQDAARLLSDAVAVDPLNEHLHQQAVHALNAVGDHIGAQALHHAHTQRLTHAGLIANDHSEHANSDNGRSATK